MSERGASAVKRTASTTAWSVPQIVLQRQCACGQHTIAGGECQECKDKQMPLHRRSENTGVPAEVPPIVHEVLRSPGQPLDAATRAFFEPRFGYDFSRVRVHADGKAAESSRAVNALAYAVGHHLVFGAGQYDPTARGGRNLLAHELTHAVQQGSIGSSPDAVSEIGDSSSSLEREAHAIANAISRGHTATVGLSGMPEIARITTCTPAAVCSGGPIAGSAQEADITGTSREAGPRARRKKMSPVRAVATGHAGRARQLEKFLEAEAPGKLANLQGIFVDQDIAAEFDATTTSCADWISDSLPAGSPTPPGMAGATKLCTFVHGSLNQQALAFNTTKDATIGGRPRERWRAETLELLIHETEHPRFEAATGALANPAGVTSASCQRANVLQELSELAAMLSEFSTVFETASAEKNPNGPLHQSMDRWFEDTIQKGGENIKSALEQMGCSCTCSEVDAFVTETFRFESGSWSNAQKDALHRELRKPKWGIRWPLPPSTP